MAACVGGACGKLICSKPTCIGRACGKPACGKAADDISVKATGVICGLAKVYCICVGSPQLTQLHWVWLEANQLLAP